MTILKNFDFDAIRKQRARRAARGGVDLVSAIDAISPDIGKLKVGETAEINTSTAGDSIRKAVMNVTAKLNNLTVKGADWEGRVFRVMSDGVTPKEGGKLYVQRGEDLKGNAIRVRKPRQARAATEAAATGTGTAKVEGGAVVRETA